LRHLTGLSKAAITRSHGVSIFFNEESVKLLLDPRLELDSCELLACITSSQAVGIIEEKLIAGARMSSLAEMVMLMEKCDRTLFMG
jgi:sulfur relay (sulfurtransferase) complex TusBCD TusD component (DsrE family)